MEAGLSVGWSRPMEAGLAVGCEEANGGWVGCRV